MTCQFCGSAIHVGWDCPKKPSGWMPFKSSPTSYGGGNANVARSSSDLKRYRRQLQSKDERQHPITVSDKPLAESAAGKISVSKLGRPRNGFDKAAYNRDYMRKRRSAMKEGK